MTDNTESVVKKATRATTTGNSPLHTVYFYYMKYAPDGSYAIKAYIYFDFDHPVGNVRTRAVQLAENAINDGSNPPLEGTEFDDVRRERKGYFVIALDGAEFTDNDPVTFYCDDSSVATSKGNDGKHTFSYHSKFEETVEGRRISFVVYKSHAQSYKDKDDLDRNEYEHFRIKFEGNLTVAAALASPYLYDDSGGTNMGPPPPPPFVPPV